MRTNVRTSKLKFRELLINVAGGGDQDLEIVRLSEGESLHSITYDLVTVWNDGTAATISFGDYTAVNTWANAVSVNTGATLGPTAVTLKSIRKQTAPNVVRAVVACTAEDATTGQLHVRVGYLSHYKGI